MFPLTAYPELVLARTSVPALTLIMPVSVVGSGLARVTVPWPSLMKPPVPVSWAAVV
jgi:hypothetical protein